MQIRMTALLVVLAVSAAALPVAAQDNPKQPAAANPKQPVRAGTPRAVAERVLASLARKDAEAFTRDVHPEAIAAFRANVVRILEQSATPDQRAQGHPAHKAAHPHADGSPHLPRVLEHVPDQGHGRGYQSSAADTENRPRGEEHLRAG